MYDKKKNHSIYNTFFSIMSAINNLEKSIIEQSERLNQLQKSVAGVLDKNDKKRNMYSNLEIFIFIFAVATLQALFLYYT